MHSNRDTHSTKNHHEYIDDDEDEEDDDDDELYSSQTKKMATKWTKEEVCNYYIEIQISILGLGLHLG